VNIKTGEKCPCPGCDGRLGTNESGVIWCYKCGRVYRDDAGTEYDYEPIMGKVE